MIEALRTAYKVAVKRIRVANVNISDRDELLLEKFTNTLVSLYGREAVGENYLYLYLSYQINYWVEKDTHRHSIPVSWIFGEKAVERFKKRSQGDSYHSRVLMSKLGLGLKVLFPKDTVIIENTKWEDRVKRVNYKTEKGYTNCIIDTTLFDKKSELCLGCGFRDRCLVTLKKLYPNIYIKRGYLKDENRVTDFGREKRPDARDSTTDLSKRES